MTICGIDPGQKGGIAFLKGTAIEAVHPMPVLDKKIDVRALIVMLEIMGPDLVVIEQQSIRPMQSGAMAIGANYGRLLACVEALSLPHRIITPAQWNKAAGIKAGLTGRAKKEASYALCRRTWGAAFDRLGLRPAQDGQYEAALIARFGA